MHTHREPHHEQVRQVHDHQKLHISIGFLDLTYPGTMNRQQVAHLPKDWQGGWPTLSSVAGAIFASFLVDVMFPAEFNFRTMLADDTSPVQGVFIEMVLNSSAGVHGLHAGEREA